MMLKELLETGSLWTAIAAAEPFPFITEYTPEVMDSQTRYNFGARTICESAEGMAIDELAPLIASMHRDKWNSLISVAALDITKGTIDRTTTNETNKENRQNTSATTNKVAAFNSPTLVDTEGNSTNGDEELEGERERVTSREISSLKDAYDGLNLQTKNSILQTVLADTAQFITLSIY